MGVRLDLLLLECVGEVCKRTMGETMWQAGGREIALEKLHELGVTEKPVTAVDAARACGFLGKDPNVIDLRPNRGKRRGRHGV